MNFKTKKKIMKSDFDKKEELYQEKITKLSTYNPQGQNIKNYNESEEQQNMITELKRKYELAEYEMNH